MTNLLLEMLIRASNGVGYTNYPDNVVQLFVRQAASTGIDVFRIFDPLNWVENMRVCIDAVLETGKLCEAAFCYTGDIHDPARAKYSLKPMAEAAIGAEKPTMKEVQPLRNPKRGWYNSERNTYSPPACGIAVPSCPYARAPQRAIMPPTTHKTSMSNGLPRSAMSNPLVVKLPAPTMLAMTMFVKGKRPSFLSSFEPDWFSTAAYFSDLL
jgi:hypothetical protein